MKRIFLLTLLLAATTAYAQQFAANMRVARETAPPSAPVVSSSSFYGDVHLLTSNELSKLIDSFTSSTTDEPIGAFIVSSNPVRVHRANWIPVNNRSYTINVPPLSKLVVVMRNSAAKAPSLYLRGFMNESRDWMNVSSLIEGSTVYLVKAPQFIETEETGSPIVR